MSGDRIIINFKMFLPPKIFEYFWGKSGNKIMIDLQSTSLRMMTPKMERKRRRVIAMMREKRKRKAMMMRKERRIKRKMRQTKR